MRFCWRGQILQDRICVLCMRLFLCKRSKFQNLLTVLSSHSSVNRTPEGRGVRVPLTLVLRTIIFPRCFLGIRSESSLSGNTFNCIPHLPVFRTDLLLAKVPQNLPRSLNPIIKKTKTKKHPSSQRRPINITASCVYRSSVNPSIYFQQ